jgi:hypothetical protein
MLDIRWWLSGKMEVCHEDDRRQACQNVARIAEGRYRSGQPLRDWHRKRRLERERTMAELSAQVDRQ